MYKKIRVPVDAAHIARLDQAITTATDLAKHYGIPICFVGATAQTPTEVARTPKGSPRSSSHLAPRNRATIRPSVSTLS